MNELQQDATNNGDIQNHNDQDLIVRDGFPCLYQPFVETNDGENDKDNDNDETEAKIVVNKKKQQRRQSYKPLIDGIEPIPRFPFWAQENVIQFSPSSSEDNKHIFDNHNHNNDAAAGGTTQFDYLKSWQDDCQRVFTARTMAVSSSSSSDKNDEKEKICISDMYSTGQTFFLPATHKPRCALEELVQTIFIQHTKHLPEGTYNPKQSGAEWWTLVLDVKDDDENENGNGNDGNENINNKIDDDENDKKMNKQQQRKGNLKKDDDDDDDEDIDNDDDDDDDDDDEVGLHFDADYELEEQSNYKLLLHPRLATVTYLSDVGAPTLVFNKKSPAMDDGNKLSLQNIPIKQGWLCHPQIGKHMSFDGRFLHGAPALYFPSRKILEKNQNIDTNRNSGDGNINKRNIEKLDDDDDYDNDNDERKLPALKKQKLVDSKLPATAAATTSNTEGLQSSAVASASASAVASMAGVATKDTKTETNRQKKRYTLLVNIWLNHWVLDAALLDDEICQQLQTPWNKQKYSVQKKKKKLMPASTTTTKVKFDDTTTKKDNDDENNENDDDNDDDDMTNNDKNNKSSFVWNANIDLSQPIPIPEIAQPIQTVTTTSTTTTNNNNTSSKNNDNNYNGNGPNTGTTSLSNSSSSSSSSFAKVKLFPSTIDPAGEDEIALCHHNVTIKYNPTMEECHYASTMMSKYYSTSDKNDNGTTTTTTTTTTTPSTIELELAPNTITLTVGAEIKEEDDDDDEC